MPSSWVYKDRTATDAVSAERRGDFFQGDTLVVFCFFLTLVCILQWSFLTMPPVWDAVAGVFAPAIYLYGHSGDIFQLLRQSGYIDGGPNVHSLSLVTWLTYAAIYLTRGDPELYLPILHVIQFGIAAAVLTATFGLARCLLGVVQAWILSACLLVCPLFLVQTGYLYTEVLGAALVLLALLSWSARHYGYVILFSIVACLVKSFGVALVFTMVFLIAIDASLALGRRLSLIALLVTVATALVLTKWALTTSTGFTRTSYQGYFSTITNTLDMIPDIKALVMLCFAVPVVFLIRQTFWRPALFVPRVIALLSGNIKARAWLATALFPIALVAFIAAVPLTGENFFPLPRYYVWSLPLMLILLGGVLTRTVAWLADKTLIPFGVGPQKFSVLLLALLFIYMALNRDGALYPRHDSGLTSFSIVERSLEYLSFFDIQLKGTRSAAELASGTPTFVTRGAYYFLSSPLMGYVDHPIKDLRFIKEQPYKSLNPSVFPQNFLLLDTNSNPFHGQKILKNVLRFAYSREDYRVEVIAQHANGPYRSVLYRISHLPPGKNILDESANHPE